MYLALGRVDVGDDWDTAISDIAEACRWSVPEYLNSLFRDPKRVAERLRVR